MGEKVAAWFRVSTTAQSELNQYPEVERHCRERGYEIVRRFELHGDSAYHGRQEPELLEVLADIESGRYSVVVTADSSRLDRRSLDVALSYVLSVRAAGGRIESVREPSFGQPGLGGTVSTVVAVGSDNSYSLKIAQNTRAGHVRIDDNGAARTKPPWGYKLTGEKYAKKMIPTPQGRRYVPQVFGKIAAGDSTEKVANWLTEQTGKKFWAKTVASMIRRPAYYGDHQWKHAETGVKGNVTGTVTRVHRCEPLTDFGTWQKANDRLDEPPHRGRSTNRPAMLRGLVTCGECGSRVTRRNCPYTRKGDGARIFMWYYGHCEGCKPSLMVRLERADMAVSGLMDKLGYVKVPDRKRIPGTDWKSMVKLTERRLAQLHTQVSFTDPAYLTRQAELMAELTDYSGRPEEPERWVETDTERTFADVWNALETDAERNAFLVAQRFRVRLWRDRLEVTQGERGDRSWRQVTVPLPVIPRARKRQP